MGMVMAQSDGTLVRTNALTTKGGNTTINGKTITIGDDKTTIKMPGQAADGEGILGVNSDGTVVTIDADIDIDDIGAGDIVTNATKIEKNTNKINKNTKRIKKLEKGMDRVQDAAEAAGAVGAALSGVPELSPFADEPVRCGISAGGYGSQYALAAGCAARLTERVQINGAFAYTPSVDYNYGSSSSIAGRVGFSFPLGVNPNKPPVQLQASGQNWLDPKADRDTSTSSNNSNTAPPVQPLWYRTEVKHTIAKLQSDVVSRDQQIDTLKSKLELLIEQQNQTKTNPEAQAAQSNSSLIPMLQQRIDELEQEKQQAEQEDQQQDNRIKELEQKLADQESRFTALMKRLQGMLPKQQSAQEN